MCAQLGRGDNDFWVHVADLNRSEIHLERRSPVPGYCIVVWSGRHVAEPTELSEAEAASYFHDVLRTGWAVERHFRPVKLNYMTLGNTLPHLHTHIIPRFEDDPAPGGPLPWDLIFSSPHRPEAELRGHAGALREALARR